jgi:hypothetical protein
MHKKSRNKNNKPEPSRQLPWLSLAAGGAILLIIVGAVLWWASPHSNPMTMPRQLDSPRLTVDRTMIDDGYVKFDTPVRAAFRLNNTGNQPLQILGEPQVKLIEGC